MTDRPYDDADVRALAIVVCRSFPCNSQGTCAALCMDQLGSAKGQYHGCRHAADIHGKRARAILDHLTAAGWRKEADVLEDAANGIRDAMNTKYPRAVNEVLSATAETLFEEVAGLRHE